MDAFQKGELPGGDSQSIDTYKVAWKSLIFGSFFFVSPATGLFKGIRGSEKDNEYE